MTFPEHVLRARSWARRWGVRQTPYKTQAVSQRALGFRGWGDPSAGQGGAGLGAGIPQLGVTRVWEPQTLD